jgi:hypothetical protein
MRETLWIRPGDQVVELVAGLGATARPTIGRNPANYTGVDRHTVAVSVVARPRPVRVRGHSAASTRPDLPTGARPWVYGEAMLTMQPEPAKRRVVVEACRLPASAASTRCG